jgi:hypothetical protein
MTRQFILPAMLATVLLFSCHSMKEKMETDSIAATESADKTAANAEQPDPLSDEQSSPSADSTPASPIRNNSSKPSPVAAPVDWDRKIIRTANLTFEVPNFNSFTLSLAQKTKQFGGYIASENQEASPDKISTTVSIKVPVAQFQDLLNVLPQDGAIVVSRLITSEDVSTQVVDINARLETKKQVRQKYMEFFKSAKNMDEVLKVQTEVNDIQEGMESAASRMNYLKHASAMSTINLTYYQWLKVEENNIVVEDGFLHKLSESFTGGAKWIGGVMLALVNLWPAILIVLVLIFGYRKWLKASKK